MENFAAPWMLTGLKQGSLSLPVFPDRPLAMVAIDDIGAYGAAALANPGKFSGEVIELAGDELTFPHAFAAISKITGSKINYIPMSYEDCEKYFGLDFTIMFRWFNDVGYIHNIPALTKKYGIPATNFSDYLKTAPWVKTFNSADSSQK